MTDYERKDDRSFLFTVKLPAQRSTEQPVYSRNVCLPWATAMTTGSFFCAVRSLESRAESPVGTNVLWRVTTHLSEGKQDSSPFMDWLTVWTWPRGSGMRSAITYSHPFSDEERGDKEVLEKAEVKDENSFAPRKLSLPS